MTLAQRVLLFSLIVAGIYLGFSLAPSRQLHNTYSQQRLQQHTAQTMPKGGLKRALARKRERKRAREKTEMKRNDLQYRPTPRTPIFDENDWVQIKEADQQALIERAINSPSHPAKLLQAGYDPKQIMRSSWGRNIPYSQDQEDEEDTDDSTSDSETEDNFKTSHHPTMTRAVRTRKEVSAPHDIDKISRKKARRKAKI